MPATRQLSWWRLASSWVLNRYTPFRMKVVLPVGKRWISSLKRAPSAKSAAEAEKVMGCSLRWPTVRMVLQLYMSRMDETILLKNLAQLSWSVL